MIWRLSPLTLHASPPAIISPPCASGPDATNATVIALGPGNATATPALNATTPGNATGATAPGVAPAAGTQPQPSPEATTPAPATDAPAAQQPQQQSVPGITTETFTSGPGAAAVAAGSDGGMTQTSESVGGARPTVSVRPGGLQIFDPIFTPGIPPQDSFPFPYPSIGGDGAQLTGGQQAGTTATDGGDVSVTTSTTSPATGRGGQPVATGVAAVSVACEAEEPLVMEAAV